MQDEMGVRIIPVAEVPCHAETLSSVYYTLRVLEQRLVIPYCISWACTSKFFTSSNPVSEVVCHSLIRALLPVLESTESKKYTSSRSYSPNVYKQITEVQHLNYWERLRKLKLYSLQKRRERYIILYIWKVTQHMVPNIDNTMRHKKKSETIEDMEHGVL